MNSRALVWLLLLAALACAWPLAAGANADAPPITVSLAPSTIVANGSDMTTITATVSQGTPSSRVVGDTVTFTSTDPGQTISPTTAVTAADGTATATLTSSTTVGTSTIGASDPSGSSGSAVLTQTAGPPATMTLAVNPSTIVADGLSSTTATATVSDAQGHPINDDRVQFSSTDPGQTVGATVPGVDGTYTATIRSSATAGDATITASDGTAPPKQTTLHQVSGPTSVLLLASQSTAATNENVTLWAAVTARAGQPAGTITFSSGGVALPHCAGEPITPANAVASCRASFAAAVSPVTIIAVFTPAAGSTWAGASAGTVIDVTRDTSSVGLSTPATIRVGQRTTYVAAISPGSGRTGPVVPSGSVTFYDGAKPISSCGAVPVRSGGSACTVTYTAAGAHTISARYGGDANFTGSTSPSRGVEVSSPPIRGNISATMQWTFRFTSKYTSVLQFGISGATHATVTVGCRGGGCPFAKRTVSVPGTQRCGRRRTRVCPTHGKADLVRYFQHHRLRPGATITVLISRPSWVGKHYTFTMRARRGPAIAISCMAPGKTRPGVGCST